MTKDAFKAQVRKANASFTDVEQFAEDMWRLHLAARPELNMANILVYQAGYNDAIDNACQWIENNHAMLVNEQSEDAVLRFRKAMKQWED